MLFYILCILSCVRFFKFTSNIRNSLYKLLPVFLHVFEKYSYCILDKLWFIPSK